MDPGVILEVVDEMLLLSLGGSDSEAASDIRKMLVVERHPDFADKYPKLVDVCCAATTSQSAESVRRFLPLMIAQMRSIDAGSATFDDASKAVGLALGEHFLPQVQAHPQE